MQIVCVAFQLEDVREDLLDCPRVSKDPHQVLHANYGCLPNRKDRVFQPCDADRSESFGEERFS